MAIRDIVIYPDSVLTTPTERVSEITPEIRTLLDDMAETMYYGDGIGLAAPQVGVSLRVMVMDVAPRDEQGTNLTALINPEIVERSGDIVYEEGCLSFPGLLIDVKRSETVRVHALGLDGEDIEIDADGLPAICLQHEIDHLDGVTFVDRLSPLKRRRALKEFERLLQAAESD